MPKGVYKRTKLSPRKGKSFEECFGKEKADAIRKNMSIAGKGKKSYIRTTAIRKKQSKRTKGKTWTEIFGVKRAKEIRKKIIHSIKGKTLEEFYGKERAVQIRKANSIGHEGKKNASWKGGITPVTLAIRGSSRYAQWRFEVFKRDKFICQKCGYDKGGNLEAHHHLRHFNGLLQDYGIDSIEKALTCEELWDTDFGKTYCKKCHEEEHRIKKPYATSEKEVRI